MPNNKVVVWARFLFFLAAGILGVFLLVKKGGLEPGDLRILFLPALMAVLYFSKISHMEKNGGEISDEEVDSLNFFPEDDQAAESSEKNE